MYSRDVILELRSVRRELSAKVRSTVERAGCGRTCRGRRAGKYVKARRHCIAYSETSDRENPSPVSNLLCFCSEVTKGRNLFSSLNNVSHLQLQLDKFPDHEMLFNFWQRGKCSLSFCSGVTEFLINVVVTYKYWDIMRYCHFLWTLPISSLTSS